jgi:diguanylate cyclase (GGDEF)-like protein
VITNVIVALGYFLGSYVGTQLTIVPSYASPIWPASGVALVAALIYGRKILPGLFIGAFLAQYYSFHSSTGNVYLSEFISFIISIGSVLQAFFGAWLIRKFIGDNDPLIENNKIIHFFLLGGPVSCITSATIGTTALLITGIVPLPEFLLTWGTWWIGDTIGVLIVAPILLILFARPREIWKDRIKPVVYPMLVLLAMVMVLFEYGKTQDWQRISNEFERQVNLFHESLNESLKNHIHVNTALKAFFDTVGETNEDQFNNFARSIHARADDILALEWIPRVTHGQRAEFETAWLGSDLILEPDADKQMVPATVRDEYYPIRYVIPYEGNERARGYDISVNAVALVAALLARDTGNTTVTGPLLLVQDLDNENLTGTVFYSPVYANGYGGGTVEERREHIRGLVATLFRISDQVHKILGSFQEIQLNLQIVSNGESLFSNLPVERQQQVNINLEKSITLKVADKDWTFTYVPSKIFIQNQFYWNIWFLLLGGLLVTAMTGSGLLMLTGNTIRIEEQVRQRTHELHIEARVRRQILDERQKQNRILRAIVSTTPLSEILELIVEMAEASDPEQICSILLLDEDGKHIRHGAAPGLPDFYNNAIDGLEIGPQVGSCGTAMYTGKQVIVEDIENHPYWVNYLELTRKAGLRACWSTPIFDTDNHALGSFAIYYRTVKSPDEANLKKINELAQLASIAIERKNRERQIQRLAFYDMLTDLPNRRTLMDHLEQQIASASRRNEYGAMLFIDLDNFKTLNDSLGHQVGDQLLIQIAQRFGTCIREEDTAGRLGGDEFIILLRDTNPELEKMSEQVIMLAQRIKEELNKPYNLDGYLHHITPSIGITFLSRDNNNPDEILKQADAAMYSAKAKGRNAISFYHPDMQKMLQERLELEKDLRTAISEHQFILYYQPLYDQDARIISAEALVRWQHPVKGILSPAVFIHVAEECGLISQIGDWVLEEVCRCLQTWNELDNISINVSPIQLKQANFVDTIRETVSRFRINPHRLILEMTESIMIGEIGNTRQKLEALQKLGVRIAIDDFGTGYSSLVYLKNLPLDQLKIDRGFVHDIETDSNDKTIVETIIAMARHLQLEVIAEGVETEFQANFLREQGCDAYQGYYFSKPLPADEFAGLLTTSASIKIS